MQRPLPPTTEVEERYWSRGLRHIAGLDEVGRGPWAGPVVAAAVVFPPDPSIVARLDSVRDSKTLTRYQRMALCTLILEEVSAVGIGSATSCEIDAHGIVAATRLAMQRALCALPVAPDALIIDALALPYVPLPQSAFPRADARSLSVASASILAKVHRDAWMERVAEAAFPGYGFARHKGYGSREHQAALDQLGICPLHRRSFRPISMRSTLAASQ